MSGWARVLTVTTIIAFFVVIFLGLGLSSTLTTKPTAGRGEQCEALATTTDPHATILEPQNTWSNLAYLIAGALVLYRSRNLLGAAVGLNLAFEFLFSGLYHAKLNDTTQTIDVAWIYVLLLSLIVYAIQSLLFAEWGRQTAYPVLNAPVLIATGISIVVVVLGVLMGIYKNEVFESTMTTLILVGVLAVLLAIGLIVLGLRGVDAMIIVMPIVLVISIGIPTLLFKFSDGPEHKMLNWCCPKAVLQSHSGWHILSAVLVLVAYDFFANFSGDGRIFSFARPSQEFEIPATEGA
jgi:hypothetical protein